MRRRYHRWTPAEDAVLAAHYPHTRTEEVASMLGLDPGRVYRRACALGIRKTAEYLATDRAGRFAPGDARGAGTRFQAIPQARVPVRLIGGQR